MKKLRGIFLVSIILIGMCAQCFAYDQAVYVWQRSWDRHVKDAIASIKGTAGYFTVLCGDMKFEGEKPVITPVNIKWEYLFQTESSATLAFRINTKASKFFGTTAVNELADSIGTAISKTINSAPANKVVGIQIDYDCPTSKLSDYVKLIKLIKKRFNDLEISITALPTWLDSADFPALAASCDYYVLQVHSFKVPDTLDEALRPFSGDAVSSWVKKASRIGYPFYLSLPTYGYEVSFNENGKFLGLRAETPPISYKPGTKHALVMTDPKRILSFLNEIESKKPEHLLGVIWFRLPLKTDEFNWSMETLKMIIARQSPGASIKSEMVSPDPGLYEVYVINDGQTNIFKDVNFTVIWNKDAKVMNDVISGYREEGLQEGSGIKIIGMPPKTGNKQLVAWFRTGRENVNPLKVGEVEGYEK